jgi:hypothetical protein
MQHKDLGSAAATQSEKPEIPAELDSNFSIKQRVNSTTGSDAGSTGKMCDQRARRMVAHKKKPRRKAGL